MLQTIYSRIAWFAALILLQALVCSHIHLGGYAIPLPYVYLLCILPMAAPRWVFILTGFVTGLAADIMVNTPGMAAASMTACGLLAPMVCPLFAPTDAEMDEFRPSAVTMKWSGFLSYAALLTLAHCILFFAIEAFTLSLWPEMALTCLASAALTMLFITAFEMLRKPHIKG